MIEFYYHYAKSTNNARLVVGVLEYYVTDIFCFVNTYTERAEEWPQFVVRGKCNDVKITNGVAVIS